MSETPPQLAQRLAKEVKHPHIWNYYLIDLLKAMERQASGTDPSHPKGYEEMLKKLRDTINYRLGKVEWED